MPAAPPRDRALRVGVAGIWHETNTFSVTPTTLDDFAPWQLQRGDAVLSAHSHVRDEVGGFITAGRRHGLRLNPSLYAAAVPSGPVERGAHDVLLADLLAGIDPAVDGLLLALHGAMVVDGLEDAEARIVRHLRQRLGPHVPIVATLDFHANPSRALFDLADVLIGYDTYPHVDAYERGCEASKCSSARSPRAARLTRPSASYR